LISAAAFFPVVSAAVWVVAAWVVAVFAPAAVFDAPCFTISLVCLSREDRFDGLKKSIRLL
jgi:hypothetical protein